MEKKRRGLDLKRLTIIEEIEVPAKPIRYTPYREMLKRIRKGKALVISDEEMNTNTVRAGIRRLQKRGEFKRIVLRQMKDKDGVLRLYVINPAEKEGLDSAFK